MLTFQKYLQVFLFSDLLIMFLDISPVPPVRNKLSLVRRFGSNPSMLCTSRELLAEKCASFP